MMNLSNLSDEELIALYRKTNRQITELNKEECGKGTGANLYVYMNLVPKNVAKAPPQVVEAIFCPGKHGKNAFVSLPDPRQQLTQRIVEVVSTLTDNETAARVATRIASTPTNTSSMGGY